MTHYTTNHVIIDVRACMYVCVRACVYAYYFTFSFRQVLEVIAGVKGMDITQLAQQVFSNTCTLFKW